MAERRDGVGFAELNAICAASFPLWDVDSTRKARDVVVHTDDQENRPLVDQADLDALDAFYA